MTRRDCPNCGVDGVLSEFGVKRVYQGTPSWSDMRSAFDRFTNDPHTELFCTNCYHTQ